MNKAQVLKKLNICYYAIMFAALAAGTIAYLLVVWQKITPIDPLSVWGKVIQYVVILDVLLTVPGGLWWHKRTCSRLAKIEDESLQLAGYHRSAKWRIILVSNTMVLAFPAFYLLGAYMSMLWVAAIAAIGWYFTKPTEKKLYFELHPEVEQY